MNTEFASLNHRVFQSAIILGGLLLTLSADAITVTDQELAERRNWVAARFEGQQPPPRTDPVLLVFTNHGPVLKNSRAGKPLRIAGQDYTNGILCHARSKVLVRLPSPAATFTAVVGIDSNELTTGGRGSVDFSVQIRGIETFRSGVLREGMAGKPVSVNLAGATEFVIQSDETPDGIGWDHANWCGAKVILKDGEALYLSDLPVREIASEYYSTEPMFSFLYGAESSSKLLPGWKRERSSRTLSAQRTERTMLWTDPQTGLQVRCVAIEYQDFPTVEWTLFFKNTGTNDTSLLSSIQSLDLNVSRTAEAEFLLHYHTADNCTADSYQPHVLALSPNAEQRFASSGGRPTTGSFPYFNLEHSGGGVIAVLGWPGQWAAQFTRDSGTMLRLRAGQELTNFKLRPGEEVRTPLVTLQFWTGGDWIRAQNIWRRWMVAHNLPRPGGKLVSTHYGGCFGEMRPRASEEIAQFDGWLREGIALDYWFIDAGWYVHPPGWWNIGTWEVDRERFPRGLREVADHLHKNNSKFVVWFEPERVVDGSWLAKNHPDWILRSGGARLVNMGNTNAWKWILDRVDSLLASERIDVYRQDFNMDPLGCWRAADPPDRQGLTEIRHVEGYLAFWDELLRRHPGLLIDTCASGGRRNDLETLRRSVPLLRSDYPLSGFNASCSEGQQCHTFGLSLWIPYHGTGMPLSDPYTMRSGFVPAFRMGWDVKDRKADLALLRRTVTEFRETEKFLLADFYPLTPWSLAKDVWLAWQYNRPEQRDGLVQAFRREGSPYETARFKLRDLKATSSYVLKDFDNPKNEQRFSGRELMERGLPVTFPAQRSSGLIVYRAAE